MPPKCLANSSRHAERSEAWPRTELMPFTCGSGPESLVQGKIKNTLPCPQKLRHFVLRGLEQPTHEQPRSQAHAPGGKSWKTSLPNNQVPCTALQQRALWGSMPAWLHRHGCAAGRH